MECNKQEVVILCAGRQTRSEASCPKALQDVNGHSVLAWTILPYYASDIRRFCIVINSGNRDVFLDELGSLTQPTGCFAGSYFVVRFQDVLVNEYGTAAGLRAAFPKGISTMPLSYPSELSHFHLALGDTIVDFRPDHLFSIPGSESELQSTSVAMLDSGSVDQLLMQIPAGRYVLPYGFGPVVDKMSRDQHGEQDLMTAIYAWHMLGHWVQCSYIGVNAWVDTGTPTGIAFAREKFTEDVWRKWLVRR